MTFDDMQRRVYSVLRDENKEFVKDYEVEDWLNEAQLDIAQRLKLLRTETTGTVAANSKIALPSDLTEILSLRIEDDDDVRFVDDIYYNEWKDELGTPDQTLGRIFNGYIELYPDVTDDDYTLRYVKSPTDLSAGSSSSALPTELHIKMVHYARAQGLWKEGEEERGDRYMQMYEQGLPPAPLGQTRLQPGPMRLEYEATPWDSVGQHRG